MTSVLRKKLFADFLLFILAGAAMSAFGQCESPVMPEGQAFEVASDYRSSDAKASDALIWLSSHPIDECTNIRERLNAFVLVWLSGHPDITINLNPVVLPFLDEYPELLFPMLHGMAAFQLGKPLSTVNSAAVHAAGLKVIVDVAGRSDTYRRHNDIRALRKMRRRGKLEAHCRSLLEE